MSKHTPVDADIQRLQDINAELLEALLLAEIVAASFLSDDHVALCSIRAAIAKARGEG
jgi:hypothetical protein